MSNRDCRTCAHNMYREIEGCSHFDCLHPVSLQKKPRYQGGDPAMVNFRTGDVPIRDIGYFANCPTWEQAA